MKNFSFSAFIALFAILLTTACNDPTTIGADLLNDDRINTAQTDTITILSSAVYGDSVLIHKEVPVATNVAQQSTNLLGNYEDPIFGKVTSNLAFNILPPAGFLPSYLNLEMDSDTIVSLDSMILILPYNAETFYAAGGEVELELYELTSKLDSERNYYSNESLDVAASPIASYTFTPMPLDSFVYYRDVVLTDAQGNDSIVNRRIAQVPQMRLILPDDFANEFIAKKDLFDSVDGFVDEYPGFYMKVVNNDGGMMSFNFASLSVGLEINTKGIAPNNDTIEYESFINISSASVRTNEFRHDFAGSLVEGIVNGNSDQDTILAVQGMQGVVGILEFPTISNFGDLIINKAELTISALNLDGNENYEPIDQIFISSVNNDGTFTTIEDIFFSLDAFGGSVATDAEGNVSYTFNITAAIQRMADGGYDTNKLALTPLARGIFASRVVLAGPKHDTNPMKLRIIYTEPE